MGRSRVNRWCTSQKREHCGSRPERAGRPSKALGKNGAPVLGRSQAVDQEAPGNTHAALPLGHTP